MTLQDKPDPNIDWERFNYNNKAAEIRPDNGFKYCPQCKKLKAINLWNFSRCSRSGDGYNFICKECNNANNKKYREKHKKSK